MFQTLCVEVPGEAWDNGGENESSGSTSDCSFVQDVVCLWGHWWLLIKQYQSIKSKYEVVCLVRLITKKYRRFMWCNDLDCYLNSKGGYLPVVNAYNQGCYGNRIKNKVFIVEFG